MIFNHDWLTILRLSLIFIAFFTPEFYAVFTFPVIGVYIDSDLSMHSHVQRTVSRCFATLRHLRTIRRQVPTTVFQSLVIALVLPHLDYCNSVLYGLPNSLIRRLQSVQNAAASLYSVYGVPSTSLLRSSVFIGCESPSASPSSWQF